MSENMDEKKCIVCDKKAPTSCSACFKVDYCSVEHQKQHWIVHKKDCSYFKIVEDPEFPELGKGFVATRDIKAGTIILEESPLVFSCWAEQPACITCGLIFTRSKPGQKCEKCQWPVCSRRCEKMDIHTDNECKLFASNGFLLNIIPDVLAKDMNAMDVFLTMIRTLLLKKNGSDIYNKILELKSERNIPEFAVKWWCWNFLKPALASFDLSVEDEELLRLYNIFRINFHRISVTCEDSGSNVAGLYFRASRMNHSCVPNCGWTASQPPGSLLRIRTVVNIRKGEPLTIRYFNDNPKMADGTKKRQQITLREGFRCKCRRCLDPTELGTYSSAIVCTSCGSKSRIGYFLPENPLNLSDDSAWRCNSCGSIKPSSVLLRPIEEAHEMLSSKLQNYIKFENGEALMKLCKRVEEKYSGKSLHPNHWLIQECMGAVVNYFLSSKYEHALDLDTSQYVVKCGYRLLALHDVVTPGWSYPRAALQRSIGFALGLQGHKSNGLPASLDLDTLLENSSKAIELHKESIKHYEGLFRRPEDKQSEAEEMRTCIQKIEKMVNWVKKNVS